MSADANSPQRLFNIPLYPASTQFTKRHRFHGNQRFEPLPPPTGDYPYRLRLEDVVRPDQLARVSETSALVFQTIGDTGGIKSPEPQQIVAYHMENDFSLPDPPAFLYHLGDVVYYNGAYSEYYPQFYEPYAHYPAPILAIPGNHDGDPLDPLVETSLSAFASNFCAPYPHLLPEAQEVQRDAMTQPNVYWTLVAPLVTIVGLYTNVPEGGRLDEDQIDWLQGELSDAAKDRAVLVALHHPVYSADAHHGGSARMGEVLDAAIKASGRTPDLILTAHVHNYQRFTRMLDDREIPYIVAGAGGYWHLHYIHGQGRPGPTAGAALADAGRRCPPRCVQRGSTRLSPGNGDRDEPQRRVRHGSAPAGILAEGTRRDGRLVRARPRQPRSLVSVRRRHAPATSLWVPRSRYSLIVSPVRVTARWCQFPAIRLTGWISCGCSRRSLLRRRAQVMNFVARQPLLDNRRVAIKNR
jgi:Calcineurin-like phosphoesterase